METKKHGLAPVAGKLPEILILGSLPGDESLRLQQYYGNQRNMFWKVLEKVFEEPVPVDYESRKSFLMAHKIALWDVLAAAVRNGSLDSHINNEEYNDILGLLESNSSIKTIVLNGGKAAKSFARYLRAHRIDFEGIRVLPFTSTSAMSLSAGWTLDRIAAQWKTMLPVCYQHL